MNGVSMLDTSPNGYPSSTNGNLLTPIHSGNRRTNGDFTLYNIVGKSDSSPATNGSNQIAPPASPLSDNGQWSSAVGHATTGGKSGRVIERLMAENDRLKRELKEQLIKGEDYQRSMQMCKPRLEALQGENDNLKHAKTVDQTLLARRDRMILDLKQELSHEKERRHMLETRARKLEAEKDQAVEEKDRVMQRMTDRAFHAEAHSNVLESSFNTLNDQYQARVSKMRTEVDRLLKEKEEDRQRLLRLDIVSSQMHQEAERTRKLQSEMVTAWDGLSRARQQRLMEMEDETSKENNRSRALSVEMEQVVNQMKWLMSLKKNTSLGKGGAR